MAKRDTGGATRIRSGRGALLEKLRREATVAGERSPGYGAIADALGISRTTVYNWFRYDKAIDPANVERLARVLADNPPHAEEITAQLRAYRDLDSGKHTDVLDVGPSVFDTIEAGREVRVAFVDYAPVARPGDPETFLRKLVELFARSAQMRWRDVPPSEWLKHNAEADLTNLSDAIRGSGVDLGCGLMMTPDRERKVRFLPTPIRLPLEAVVLVDDLSGPALKASGWARGGPGEGGAHDLAGRLRSFAHRLLDPAHIAQPNTADQFAGMMTPVVCEDEVGHGYAAHFLGFDEKEEGHTPAFASRYDPEAYAEAILAADRTFGLPVIFADILACLGVQDHLRNRKRKVARLLFSTPPAGEPGSTAPHIEAHGVNVSPPAYFVGIAFRRGDEKFHAWFTQAFETFLEIYPDQIASMYVQLYRDLCDRTDGIVDDHERAVRTWMGIPDAAPGNRPAVAAKAALEFQRDTNSDSLRPWRQILWKAAERIDGRPKLNHEAAPVFLARRN